MGGRYRVAAAFWMLSDTHRLWLLFWMGTANTTTLVCDRAET